jgi:hypothetical protein
VPLWILFVAVQFSDYVHFILKMFGVERSEIRSDTIGPLSMDLVFIPFSHSFAAAIATSVAIAALSLFRLSRRDAILLGAAVFSHWILDLIVHTPDLPLMSDTGKKLGLGLWRMPFLSMLFEIALLACSALFLRKSFRHRPFMALLLVMIVYQILFGLMMAPPSNPVLMSAAALVTYNIFAFWAYRAVDRCLHEEAS